MTRIDEMLALSEKATTGPWRWNVNGDTKSVEIEGGRPMYDKTVMDFARWGMNRAQPRFNGALVDGEDGFNILYPLSGRKDWIAPYAGREHHKSWFANVTHPDAALIVAAVNFVRSDDFRALLAEREAMRWRPISEAPRDGTWILAALCGEWTEVGVEWITVKWAEESDLWMTPDVTFVREPDGWMPLPQPPEAREHE